MRLGSCCGVVILAVACSGRPAEHPDGGLPSEVVLRVDHVRVSETRPNTQSPWDAPVSERDEVACKLAGAAASAVWDPMAGEGVELLCGLARAPAGGADSPEKPDLMLRLSKGANPGLVSPVMPDRASALFKYEFVVPVAAVPPEGVMLEVVDGDAGGRTETIGLIRITQETLRKAWASPTHLLELESDGIVGLELVVSAYQPSSVPPTRRSASYAPAALTRRPLIAGEVVTLSAAGRYQVGSFYDQTIDPAGYPGDEARRYNFKQAPFADARHACAIALVGAGSVWGVVVGRERTFSAPFAGELRVGLNDTDPGNNQGTVTFAASTRAPSPSEWLSGTSSIAVR